MGKKWLSWKVHPASRVHQGQFWSQQTFNHCSPKRRLWPCLWFRFRERWRLALSLRNLPWRHTSFTPTLRIRERSVWTWLVHWPRANNEAGGLRSKDSYGFFKAKMSTSWRLPPFMCSVANMVQKRGLHEMVDIWWRRGQVVQWRSFFLASGMFMNRIKIFSLWFFSCLLSFNFGLLF